MLFTPTHSKNFQVILSEEENADITKYMDGSWMKENKRHPVDLDLQLVLGKMPRKVYEKI